MTTVADVARIGFPPVRDLGTLRGSMWLYHCGPQWAKRLLLTGDSLTGKDAAEIGLALKSYPADQLEAEVMRPPPRRGLGDPRLLSASKRPRHLALCPVRPRSRQRIGSDVDARSQPAPQARSFRA